MFDENLGEKAYRYLFPHKLEKRKITIRYSGKLSLYNAHMKYGIVFIEFVLSKKWLEVSDEIQIGLIQSLLLRMFKKKQDTMYIDLYNKFLKKIPTYTNPTKSDPLLEESFTRVNVNYFSSLLEKPNLVWGSENFSKLGSYEFGSDTIVISSIFKEDYELLDYVMYHEMLHKKHKFEIKNGKGYYHTSKFKADERKWHDPDAEKKIERFLKKIKIKRMFF